MLFRCEADPLLLPAANDAAAVESEDNGFEKEEELGIFQVLDRLEEVTNMLIKR